MRFQFRAPVPGARVCLSIDASQASEYYYSGKHNMVAIAHDVCPFICVRNPLRGRIPSSTDARYDARPRFCTVFAIYRGRGHRKWAWL